MRKCFVASYYEWTISLRLDSTTKDFTKQVRSNKVAYKRELQRDLSDLLVSARKKNAIRTGRPTDRPTDGRTDRPSYIDLKIVHRVPRV